MWNLKLSKVSYFELHCCSLPPPEEGIFLSTAMYRENYGSGQSHVQWKTDTFAQGHKTTGP
jgi:hypothetical protein